MTYCVDSGENFSYKFIIEHFEGLVTQNYKLQSPLSLKFLHRRALSWIYPNSCSTIAESTKTAFEVQPAKIVSTF